MNTTGSIKRTREERHATRSPLLTNSASMNARNMGVVFGCDYSTASVSDRVEMFLKRNNWIGWEFIDMSVNSCYSHCSYLICKPYLGWEKAVLTEKATKSASQAFCMHIRNHWLWLRQAFFRVTMITCSLLKSSGEMKRTGALVR